VKLDDSTYTLLAPRRRRHNALRRRRRSPYTLHPTPYTLHPTPYTPTRLLWRNVLWLWEQERRACE